jgi:hypothetical protein
MITRSQTRRLTSTTQSSQHSSFSSFSEDSSPENSFGQTFSLNLSQLSQESAPFSTGNTSENTPDDSLDVLSFLQILFEEEIPNMSTLNSNLALKLIPSFDGRLDGLLKFVEMCDTVALTASYVDNSLLLSIIFSKLEGKAFEFSREATYADWPALKAALRRKFAQTKSIAQLQSGQKIAQRQEIDLQLVL